MTGLFLRELTLSHFRSHRRAVLALDGRPVAIHGVNGAGKTNILEAVSLLSPGRGLRRAASDEIARRPEALGWKVTALLQSLHQLHEVATWAEPGGARQVTIDDRPAAQVALGRVARIVWLVPVMDRLWTEGADGRRRFLDRMAMSFEPGHAEAVLVEYDPGVISYDELLDVFWKKHDPTQVNRQGPDVGTQYRSGIYYHSEEQKDAASRSRDQLGQSGRYRQPIATEIKPAAVFYDAEEYHQRYLEKRGMTHCG